MPGGHIRLQMDGQKVRSGIRKRIHVAHRFFNHKVYIQKLSGELSQRLHHRHANADVGDKHTVHHIHMEPVRFPDPLDIPAQVGKVGGEDGGGDCNHDTSFLSRQPLAGQGPGQGTHGPPGA